jgi:predicted dehydrogenase
MSNASRKEVTRRAFMAGSACGVASVALVGSPFGAPALLADSPNNRVVLGLIGAGGRGMDVIRQMVKLPDVQVKYVCEVEESRGRSAVAELSKLQPVAPQHVVDMRQVLDDREVHGVVVATPEQWHALATIWACQAGKDVYVEKNISGSIWEGRQMIEAARKYQRIVQAGFQNRSAPYAFSARDYIANGELGKVLYVNVCGMLPTTYGSYPRSHEPDSDVPAGLDWNRWLGPARERPYNRDVHRNWYGYWDFSGGNGSDAIHTLDLARLVLGDPTHPQAVTCLGGRLQFDDGGDLPDVQIVAYQYPHMVVSFLNTGFTPYLIKSPPEVRYGDTWPYWPQNADRIEIFGTRRMMYLGRHGAGWQVFEDGNKLVAQDKGYHPDKWHVPHFIDCIRTRQKSNGDIEQCHYSACLEHLANVAYRSGSRCLMLDPATETFPDCPAANRLLKPSYREPYRVPDAV